MRTNRFKLFTASLLVFGMAIVTNVYAQSEKTWSIGPELGATFSKFGRDAGSNDMKAGVVAGVQLTYSVVNTFGVSAKALLAQKGGIVGNTKTTLNYLEIPVLGRFFLTKEGFFRPNLFIGPSFGFLLGGMTKVGSSEATKIDNYKNIYNGFDFGLTGGLGLNFQIANETRLLIDARYTYGLSDVEKGLRNTNNLPITLTAGVSFGFQ